MTGDLVPFPKRVRMWCMGCGAERAERAADAAAADTPCPRCGSSARQSWAPSPCVSFEGGEGRANVRGAGQ